MATGQFTYYWLHIDAEIGERDLAAFCGASSAQLLLVVTVLAILVIPTAYDERLELTWPSWGLSLSPRPLMTTSDNRPTSLRQRNRGVTVEHKRL